MHASVMTSLDSPDLLPKLEVQGVEIQKTSPADLGKLMAEETKKWARRHPQGGHQRRVDAATPGIASARYRGASQ